MNCTRCGTTCVAMARYCSHCGATVNGHKDQPAQSRRNPLEDSGIFRLVPREYSDRLIATGGRVRSERREVTLLFMDMVGSTAMIEALDPEDALEVMNGAFSVLVEPVTTFGGTVARLMGDGILCFFGAPTAHEDDALRACRAALKMQEGRTTVRGAHAC